MTPALRIAALATLVAPALAGAARLNTTYLVPAYEPCPRSATTTTQPPPAGCTPATRESRFTFESATLKSVPARYIKAGRVAFIVELKGVKDATGAPVTAGGFAVVSPPGQITLRSLDSTFAPGALSPALTVPFEVKNGSARVVYKTPSAQPIPNGLVTEGGSIVILDDQGKRLATVGAQSPP